MSDRGDETKGYVIHSRFARQPARGWTGAVQPCARGTARVHVRSRSNLRITLPVVVIGICSM
ncbi:MAG: hypothetical protein ACXWJL_12570, partial [Xanthobacteraceae bacterium]